MQLSTFGKKFSNQSGVVELMNDLEEAVNENPDIIFMGAGNPGRIPEMEEIFHRRCSQVINELPRKENIFGTYQSPQGDRDFRKRVGAFLKKQFGWALSEENIAVSNGSQPAFFLLYNFFAGKMSGGECRRIHFPITPEYIGYGDIGLSNDFFSATRPCIELLDNSLFKYRVDFSSLQQKKDIGALSISRPTNPTGNVLTDLEIQELDRIARAIGVPLIIDGAYGLPFPNILFEPAKPHWNENTILVLSLSKLGLPGVRTGIVVGREDIIQAFTNANTIVSLACGTLGPAIVKGLFESGEILALTRDYVTPFYRDRSNYAVAKLQKALSGLPFRIHKPEGAIFLWLWFEGLPISSQELYRRLKKRGVIVVPGHNFFIGIDDQWSHKNECLRISYALDAASINHGIELISEEARAAYQ